MKVEKEQIRVRIVSGEDLSVDGFIHINPGERLIDFLNNHEDKFIAVTQARLSGMGEFLRLGKKKDVVILNKSSIKVIEKT